MNGKPMLSVERELRGAVEQALLAIKRIYQAGHDGIVGAGGSCDQPGVMFECDPTVRGLRAMLSRPEGWLPCSPELLESGVDCATAPRWSNKEWDGHSHWHPSPAAQHQGEPVAVVIEETHNYGSYLVFGAAGSGVQQPRQVVERKAHLFDQALPSGTKLYAEQPAPVAVITDDYCIMPRRLTAENGAKALLLGEFKLEVIQGCPECAELEEPDEYCSICDGEGEYGQQHMIPWDQIKFIYSEAVKGLAKPNEMKS